MGYDDWKTREPEEVDEIRPDDPADEPEDEGPEPEWEPDIERMEDEHDALEG